MVCGREAGDGEREFQAGQIGLDRSRQHGVKRRGSTVSTESGKNCESGSHQNLMGTRLMEAKAACRRPGSKNYSREFREAVVAQANNPARSLAEVAQEYGLNANLISRWRRIHQQRFYFPGAPRSLKLCCSDGTVEIDSNVAENALRCVALRRRNFIFAGSDSGGDRAAAMYSFIATHKLNDIEPRAYLCHVLSRIAAHPVNRVDELLPWDLATTR